MLQPLNHLRLSIRQQPQPIRAMAPAKTNPTNQSNP